jgi:DNA-binding transcriptional ArsR family regulator
MHDASGILGSVGAPAKDVFRAIADPTRREILVRLGDGPRTVNDICGDFQISQPSVSAHLEVLREVGLVSVRSEGRHRLYSLDAAPLGEVMDWLSFFERFWKQRLRRLGKALDEGPRKAPRRPGKGRKGAA